jgi:hypothetical protein
MAAVNQAFSAKKTGPSIPPELDSDSSLALASMDDRHDLSEPLLVGGDEDRTVDCESAASPPTLAPGSSATLAVEEGTLQGSNFASGLEIQAGSSLGGRLEPASAVAPDDGHRDEECAATGTPRRGGTWSDAVTREETSARGPSSVSPLEVQAGPPCRGSDPTIPKSSTGLQDATRRCLPSSAVLALAVVTLVLADLLLFSIRLEQGDVLVFNVWAASTVLAAFLASGLCVFGSLALATP